MLKGKRSNSFQLIMICILISIAGNFSDAAAWIQEAQPAAYDSLKKEFDAAAQNKDFKKVIDIGKELRWVVEPMHYEMLYNTACAYAVNGDKAKAYEYLKKAVDAGFWNVRHIRDDSDWASFREEEHFLDLSRAAWSRGYIEMLERDEREDFQKSDEVLRAMAIQPGERIADVGAGSGYFTIPMAMAAGPGGSVLAIDIKQEMLDFIYNRTRAEQLDNITLQKVESNDPQLPAAGMDLIVMIDTIHYITERTAYGEKLRSGLAPGGRLVIIDYIPKPWEERPWGPPPQQHLSKETLNADLKEAGLIVVQEFDFLPEQYFVVYQAE
jgi:SAM-dependent methyltransferase